jgi:hypothetical protein
VQLPVRYPCTSTFLSPSVTLPVYWFSVSRFSILPGVLAAILILLTLYTVAIVGTVVCSQPLQASLVTVAALGRVLLLLFVSMVVFGAYIVFSFFESTVCAGVLAQCTLSVVMA